MKVVSKQRNSRMCIICGLDNEHGVKAEFYNMENDTVVSIFQYKIWHQSYPGRVHGGMITAMLDELGLRASWTKGMNTWGVTTSIETKFRKPVPYDETLYGIGKIIKDMPHFLVVETKIMNTKLEVLADAEVKYIKQDINKIVNCDTHEEMCYLLPCEISEIAID